MYAVEERVGMEPKKARGEMAGHEVDMGHVAGQSERVGGLRVFISTGCLPKYLILKCHPKDARERKAQ